MTMLETILILVVLAGLLTHVVKVSMLIESRDQARRLLMSERKAVDRLIARVQRLETSIRGIEYGGGA